MSTELGGLSARIGMNTAGLRAGRVMAQEELLKTEGAILRTEAASTRLGGAFGRLGTASKILGGLLGLELARKAGEGIKVAVEYATDLETTMARVKRVFGDSAESVIKFSDSTDKTLGRTKDQALTASVRFGTLATRLGQTKEQAAKTSIELTKLAVQLAASKGGTADDAGNALATGLVGRGMALRRYGIVLTDTSLKEEAVREGLLKAGQALTPATKMQAAYNVIVRETADVQNYFGEHLDLISEKQQVAAATTKSASEALGNALIPAERVFADLMANDVAPALKVVGEGLGFIADHKVTRDITLLGGGLGLAAIATVKLAKAFTTLKADAAKIFGHTENAAAIKAEGAAAEVTAGQLTMLAAAETRAGAAAVLAAGETAVGASAMAIPGLIPGAAGIVGTSGVAASRVGGGGMLAAGAAGLGSYEITKAILNRYGAFGHQSDGDRRRISRQDSYSGDNSLLDALKGLGGTSLLALPGAQGSYTRDVMPAIRKALAAQNVKDNAHAVSVLEDFITTTRASTPRYLLAASDAHDQTAAGVLSAQKDLSDPAMRASEASLVGGSVGGAFDALPSRTGGDVAGAQGKLARSVVAQQAATAAVALAQMRLNAVRASGKSTALQLASATDALANAHRRLDAAQGGTSKSKAALAKAAGTTGLGVGDLFGRLNGQIKNGYALRDDASKLIGDGLGRSALERVMQLEKDAPGTMDRLAATMTRAEAKSFNQKTAELTRLNVQFFNAPLVAAEAEAKAKNAAAAKRLAEATARSYKEALVQAMREFNGWGPFGSPANPINTPKPWGKGDPVAHGYPASHQTTYSLPNATIVASDPAALAKQLAAKARLAALAGTPPGHRT